MRQNVYAPTMQYTTDINPSGLKNVTGKATLTLKVPVSL